MSKKKSLILLFVWLSAFINSSLYALENIHEKDQIIPLGWSPDSRFACVICGLSGNEYTETLTVIDAVTDEILFNEIIFISDGKDDRLVLSEKESTAVKKIDICLSRFNITRISSINLRVFPLPLNRSVFQPQLKLFGKDKIITGFELYMQAGGKSKKLTRIDNLPEGVSSCCVEGYFINPNEQRLIVLVRAEGSADRYYFIGCLLTAGFH